MSPQAAGMLNPLQLAYIGDTVHDLFIRTHLLGQGYAVNRLHKQAVELVRASAQARWAEAIAPLLTEAERELIRRGRNSHARHAAPKHADPADYQLATGLETLWGFLYLTGDADRLDKLLLAGLEALGNQGK